ncbi:hypothetical protein CAP50_05745 [Psychrobacter sp. L7]|uniref:hypothetical protein n=1 Tax=Psychrobacter sp. L7 TaxID=1982756 RepID=UPI000C29A962|nr:hypothetical protein [Psychrobacter sp. L7]PJX25054.1 hypothetical protein CAP50_05745 [Psychrobacter sp. L7]
MILIQEEFDTMALQLAEYLAAYYSKAMGKNHHRNVIKDANKWSVAWYQDEINRQSDLCDLINNKKVSQEDFDEIVLRFFKALIPNFNNQNETKDKKLTLTSSSCSRVLEHARGLAVAWYQYEDERQTSFQDLLAQLDGEVELAEPKKQSYGSALPRTF